VQFGVQVYEGCRVLMVAGEIDLSNTHRVEIALLELVRAAEPLVIDLSAVEFMDSMGIRTVVLAHQRANASGSRLVLVPSPVVAMVFSMAGLDTVLTLGPTLTEALTLASA
jgi:anti-anti-sigma factor